jgi:hypothetical protein
MEPTWRLERPEATTMVSAIAVFPVRSMVTISSAFMSSRQLRMMRRVSVASGGDDFETERGAALRVR